MTTRRRVLRRFTAWSAVGVLVLSSLPLAAQTQPKAPASSAPAPGTRTTPKPEEKRILRSKEFYIKKEDPSKYEELARQKREEAIGIVRGIIEGGNVEGDQLAELKMRLAELYWETAKDAYLGEMDVHLKRYETWVTSKDPNKGAEPKEDHVKSQQYNRLAIDLYRAIIQNHRNYNRLAEVYFNLAFNLMDLGEKVQALEYYQALVKNYPQSEFVADAYLQMGEYFFDSNNAFKALGNYKKAATYTDSKVQVFALYKLGWCYYNVGEYGKAIDVMKEVIAKSAEQGEDASKLSLREESLNDLVLFYSELGDLEAAYSYFSKYGEKRHFKAMLKRLAGIYLEQGKTELGITTYRRLISEDPMDKDAPTYQSEVIDAFFKWGHKQETLEEIDRLVSEYGAGSKWAAANAANAEALKTANDYIDRNLRSVAIDYQREARKTGSKTTYELAATTFQKYLTLFPTGKFNYDMRYGYAEVLYELKRYEDAANEYERVVNLDPKGKYFQAAISSLIITIDKVLGLDKKNAAGIQVTNETVAEAQARDITPKALTPWEERKIKACDTFATALPDHKDAPASLYEAARMLYDRNLFEQANPRFQQIIERYGKLEVAEVAANLTLNSFEIRQDWEKLETTARAYHSNQNFRPEFRKDLAGLYERAAYKRVEALEQANKLGEAAKAYLAFYTEFPSSTLADRALFNSSFYFFKTGDLRKSIELREKLASSFPSSEFTGKNYEALAGMYESVADYRKAAEFYERLGTWDKARTYPATGDAYYNAALFRASLGEPLKAIADFEIYARDFASRDDAHLAVMEIARIHEEGKRWPEAMAVYKRVFTDPALSAKSVDTVFEARLRYGKILRQTGQVPLSMTHFQDSSALFEKLVKAGTKIEVGALYVAEMRFYLVEPLFSRFLAIKIDLKEAKKTLDLKNSLGEQCIKAYQDVLALKQGDWGIAALYQIGEVYRNMAQALLDSPVPPQLTADQQKIYRAALEDKAFPLKDLAAQTMESALQKSYELGIYNEYTAKAAALLAVLMPKEYPRLYEQLGTPEVLSGTFFTAEFRGK